ncbi:unnamed protein product [Mytilus edulis]|uniref:Uncharacterized protein n=1 Tax=Mytilus edulis TaxID=6550 RepID=A0A8S3T422_MYTED|nr:unnamed protein product [Mytilus edulis]
MFHLYYCIARILKELKSPLPTDSSFCYYKNPYDKAAYQKLCDEFNISPNTDWRQKLESSCQGLGSFEQYYKPSGEYRQNHKKDGPFFNIRDTIYHEKDISMAWTTFILDKSEGFTRAGIERINESIKIYVWALLGAQSQTKTEILKVGTGFDAQKQFLANVQDVINSPIDLPTQISNYQNVLKYARSKVDYVYGLELYMSPSDMVLQIGTIVGYNNKIIIATENQTLGFNDDLNNKNFDHVDFKPKEPVKPQEPIKPEKPKEPKIDPIKKIEHEDHEDNKQAIIFVTAVNNKLTTKISNAHKLFANQFTTSFVADNNQETIEPIIPGNAAANFPARKDNNFPRFFNCFSIQSCTPPFDGAGEGEREVVPPVNASTITPIIIPKAVKTLTIVIPCSLNNVLILSPNVLSSFNILCIVCLNLFT